MEMQKESFACQDLSGCTEPIMMTPGETLAYYERDGIAARVYVDHLARLGIGRVDVDYKGKNYIGWDYDFPQELKDIVEKDPNWREREDIRVNYEPDLRVQFDGFDGAEAYDHPLEDESPFLGKSKEEVHQYMKAAMTDFMKALADEKKYTHEGYRQSVLPPEWRLLPVGKDPVTEGMAEGAFGIVPFDDGKDPYQCDWSKDKMYLERTKTLARVIANFSKKGYETWLKDLGKDKEITELEKAGNAKEVRAATFSHFQSYLMDDVHPAKPSPLTKGLEKLLQSQNWKNVRKMLVGFVKGDKKTLDELKAMGQEKQSRIH